MSGEIQRQYETYQKRYPLRTRDAIVDLMLKDGVITPQTAKKIKSGVSLFLLDNVYSLSIEKAESPTNIMGGYFQNTKPKTKFNRKIEPAFQSIKQGDCWLLSDINSLNQTEWGKRAIYNAIIPDKYGGVTIKFKGSLLKQKNFYISEKEILDAKKSGLYSSGDDDMIAFELATEKYSKLLVTTGLYKRNSHFDEQFGNKSYIAGGGAYDKNGNSINISGLITGIDDVTVAFTMDTKVPPKLLKYLSGNHDIAMVCGFSQVKDVAGRDKNDPVHGGHAYAIKNFVYGKFVTLIDPYHGDKEIKLSWNKFINDVWTISISPKDNKTKYEVEKLIPSSLKNERDMALKRMAKRNDKMDILRKEEHIINEIFPQVSKILLGFGIYGKDLNFDNIKLQSDIFKNTRFDLVYNDIKRKTPTNTNPSTTEVNKDNVVLLLDIKPDFIEFLDKYKSGWGNGKEKKELISPIINALAEKAKEVEINTNIINEFKTKCFKELDAVLYTDEKVIKSEVKKILQQIKAKME